MHEGLPYFKSKVVLHVYGDLRLNPVNFAADGVDVPD